MPRVAIFTDDPGWHGARLCEAFARRGFDSQYVSLTECRIIVDEGCLPIYIPGFERALPDAVFVRGVPGGSLQQVVFYLDILHALKTLGIPVYNDGHAIERSVDKAMTSFLLRNAGLATPATWVVQSQAEAVAIAEQELNNGHKIITKPLFGSQGEGIRLLEKMTDLFWLSGSQGVFYLQRFVECDGDEYSDCRVFVINGEVVASMRRCGVSWLNNVARGARCEPFRANRTIMELAMHSISALAMDYGGIDIICDKAGNYSVIEVNSIPAWKGLQSICGLDIADLLVEDLLQRNQVILPEQQHTALCS